VNPEEVDSPISSSVAVPSEKACWTPNRRELREWLRRDAASLAELYEGAVLLLIEAPVPGYTRFVPHAVREIMNRLPDVVAGQTSRRRFDSTNRLDGLLAAWNRRGIPAESIVGNAKSSASTTEPIPPEISLPRELVLGESGVEVD
jgi:hypothetical protein